jgi:2'-5' RNA ligase
MGHDARGDNMVRREPPNKVGDKSLIIFTKPKKAARPLYSPAAKQRVLLEDDSQTGRPLMPRLFTGVEIPENLGERLSYLRGGLPGAHWISPENYHLTLRFVGDVDMREAEAVAETLGSVRRPAFAAKITGVSALGTKKPHAIVARVEATPELTELQAEHERLIQRLGLPPDGRKYTPHITLARIRNASSRDIADYLTLRGGFFAGPIPVDRFVLFSSRDSVGGGPYIVEEAYPLLSEAPVQGRA